MSDVGHGKSLWQWFLSRPAVPATSSIKPPPHHHYPPLSLLIEQAGHSPRRMLVKRTREVVKMRRGENAGENAR